MLHLVARLLSFFLIHPLHLNLWFYPALSQLVVYLIKLLFVVSLFFCSYFWFSVKSFRDWVLFINRLFKSFAVQKFDLIFLGEHSKIFDPELLLFLFILLFVFLLFFGQISTLSLNCHSLIFFLPLLFIPSIDRDIYLIHELLLNFKLSFVILLH